MGPIVVVVSESDPVASRVAERWGPLPSTGEFVEGAAVRRLSDTVHVVRRPGPHVHDERLDRLLPPALAGLRPTLVFPSIHRGEQNIHCLTVHPLGNPGGSAEIGGRPRTLVPTDPHRMAAALRGLSERSAAVGIPATFEATHHGPELDLPAFFVEIGYGEDPGPSDAAVRALAEVIAALGPTEEERVALAVGGGHYAPHFTDLVLRRRWALGHILSRHSLLDLDRATAESALRATPGAQGILYARVADSDHPALRELAPRERDGAAAPRGERSDAATRGGRSTSGT